MGKYGKIWGMWENMVKYGENMGNMREHMVKYGEYMGHI